MDGKDTNEIEQRDSIKDVTTSLQEHIHTFQEIISAPWENAFTLHERLSNPLGDWGDYTYNEAVVANLHNTNVQILKNLNTPLEAESNTEKITRLIEREIVLKTIQKTLDFKQEVEASLRRHLGAEHNGDRKSTLKTNSELKQILFTSSHDLKSRINKMSSYNKEDIQKLLESEDNPLLIASLQASGMIAEIISDRISHKITRRLPEKPTELSPERLEIENSSARHKLLSYIISTILSNEEAETIDTTTMEISDKRYELQRLLSINPRNALQFWRDSFLSNKITFEGGVSAFSTSHIAPGILRICSITKNRQETKDKDIYSK